MNIITQMYTRQLRFGKKLCLQFQLKSNFNISKHTIVTLWNTFLYIR